MAPESPVRLSSGGPEEGAEEDERPQRQVGDDLEEGTAIGTAQCIRFGVVQKGDKDTCSKKLQVWEVLFSENRKRCKKTSLGNNSWEFILCYA